MLLPNFDLLATAPGGVARLRELILTLAVQGKLVPQDPSDEPAGVLLQKIRAEKDRLIADGKIRRDKPVAEISGEEKPFGLPQGWEWVHALDMCVLITDGDHQPPPKADSGIPFLVIGDVRTGSIAFKEASRFVPLKYFEELDWGKKPCVGDVLYTTVGSFGIPVPVIEQQNFCFQRHIALFRPAITELQGFLALVLRSTLAFQQAEKGATGIAQKTVPLSVLRELRLPLPPLAEQSRIVARVEELMRLCDALEAKGRLEAAQHAQLVSTLLGTLTDSETPEALARNWQRIATHFDVLLDRPQAVDALEQTILQLAVRGLLVPQDPDDEPATNLVRQINENRVSRRTKSATEIIASVDRVDLPRGWCMTNVGSISECLDYLRRPVKKADREMTDGNIPYFGANGQTGWISDYLFDEDLVLVVEDETFIGRIKPFSYIVRGKSWVNNHAHVLRPLGGMTVEYLNLCLQHYDFIPLTSGTTNRRKLTQPGLLAAEFMIPPLAEQSRIVARVEELRRLCADLRQRLSASQSAQAHLAEALVEGVAA